LTRNIEECHKKIQRNSKLKAKLMISKFHHSPGLSKRGFLREGCTEFLCLNRLKRWMWKQQSM